MHSLIVSGLNSYMYQFECGIYDTTGIYHYERKMLSNSTIVIFCSLSRQKDSSLVEMLLLQGWIFGFLVLSISIETKT